MLNLNFTTHPCKREYCKIRRERKCQGKLCGFHIRFVLHIEKTEIMSVDKFHNKHFGMVVVLTTEWLPWLQSAEETVVMRGLLWN